MKNFKNWEEMKVAVAKRYNEVVTDENIRVATDNLVVLDLEEEVITVAKEIRSKDFSESLGYKLL